MASSSRVPAQPIDDFSNITRYDFSKNTPGFVFGTGTSAYQHEGGAARGGRGPSIWDDFTLNSPDRIADGSNGNDAADMYHKFKEDIEEMSSLGFDAYRFSISWSRILPRGKIEYGINQAGIDFYRDILETLSKYGMEPYVTLFHWDLPSELENKYGGFLSSNIIDDFRDFAGLCFEKFGDKVKFWFTLNEPTTYSVQGYVNCTFPPSEKPEESGSNRRRRSDSVDDENDNIPKVINRYRGFGRMSSNSISRSNSNPADVYTVGRNMLLAHAAAVKLYRTKFQEDQDGQIGITLVSHWFEPLTDSRADQKAAKRALDFMLGWFLEPVLIGQYPQNMLDYVPPENLKPFSRKESRLLKGSIDFLGLNYYTAHYAAHYRNPRHKKGYNDDQDVTLPQEDVHGEPIGEPTDLEWLYNVPWGIYKLLEYINRTYNNTTYNLPDIYITENGFADKNDPDLTISQACRDERRVKYHQDHLGNILKAMKLEVKIKGYFAWSWCDNFEWIDGYTVRFGIIYVDYEDEFRRYRKYSAKWFKKFLKAEIPKINPRNVSELWKID